MKLLLLFLTFVGVALIMANQLVACSRRRRPVEYRYLPRELDRYIREQPLASANFRDMFALGPYESPYRLDNLGRKIS